MLTLKEEILQMVSLLNDENILAILKTDIEYLNNEERKLTHELTPEDRIELMELMNVDSEEDTITYEEFMKSTERWRTK